MSTVLVSVLFKVITILGRDGSLITVLRQYVHCLGLSLVQSDHNIRQGWESRNSLVLRQYVHCIGLGLVQSVDFWL